VLSHLQHHVCYYIAAREHLSLRLSVAHSAIDHPPLGHLLLLSSISEAQEEGGAIVSYIINQPGTGGRC
jgi:hypothetical protein